MIAAEHRRPLAAFVSVFVAACLIMGNGLRQEVVDVLVASKTSNELIAVVAPDLVLGSVLRNEPFPGAAEASPEAVVLTPAPLGFLPVEPPRAGASPTGPSSTAPGASSRRVGSPGSTPRRTSDRPRRADRADRRDRATRPTRPARATAPSAKGRVAPDRTLARPTTQPEREAVVVASSSPAGTRTTGGRGAGQRPAKATGKAASGRPHGSRPGTNRGQGSSAKASKKNRSSSSSKSAAHRGNKR